MTPQLPTALLYSPLFPNKSSKVKPKALPNTAQGHQELISWLHKQGVERVHACIEATSTYGEALAQVLVDAGHMVSIVNPSRIKGFARSEMTRTKTDKIDAFVPTNGDCALGSIK